MDSVLNAELAELLDFKLVRLCLFVAFGSVISVLAL
jgi:hypothetical protein